MPFKAPVTTSFSSAVLESLGDENSTDFRKQKFEVGDADMDGWVNYDEFLSVKEISKHFTF